MTDPTTPVATPEVEYDPVVDEVPVAPVDPLTIVEASWDDFVTAYNASREAQSAVQMAESSFDTVEQRLLVAAETVDNANLGATDASRDVNGSIDRVIAAFSALRA